MSKLDDLMTFAALAKRVHMNRVRLRQLAIEAGIAVRWGGPDAHPILMARLSDVERVILNNRYVPPGRVRRKAPPPPGQDLHRLVDC